LPRIGEAKAATATARKIAVLFYNAVRHGMEYVAPGATEKPHHHRYPSVFVIDRIVTLRDFNGVTNEEIPLPNFKDLVFPITLKFPPQPLHYVENLDTKPFHATRIEFKQGFPAGM
jgi:hypothetical protein